MSEFRTPADLRYTAEHEWVRRTGDATARVGITDYAQSQLGDVVFVQLPETGAEITAGDSFGEVESTKSVSDVFAPLTAKVVGVNPDLDANPELVNSDPYEAGWLVDLEVGSKDELDAALASTLDADGYRAITQN
ncbi:MULTISPECIES: glycine cleavage system protein GcvH [Rhodococcus]|uniref:Glycine cleavage system H protein n=1 Tax=Rhodococcus aetherivorans TaxID=191292 RepID=A0A059MQR4_9NOCA|nr:MULTISPECIES: glycine cleavage system protein GcvH [Rhodococcus]ETT24414.1 Glycine cleavage system H protein [Rhodococcus rhodochrous ATCC 21198]NCL77597.1 Glycine cleavage system H protein [Rhodococcus sp. YH1]OOL31323.1 glycine cleavage system protein H [Rhodococcus rhodochrous]KDE13342.1 glycine cleavage system protein H [Rhodococcus aetherivorans]MDV6292183.1 glycine cleavage system protein GcvH [Rhodococcus aetherivorans]